MQKENIFMGKCSTHLLILLFCLFSLSCTGTEKKAHEISQQSVYVPVTYKNASIPGPEIIVLPGTINGASPQFSQSVSRNGIKDFAEIELTKANFKLLDRPDAMKLREAFFYALAEGNEQAIAAFKSGPFRPTNFLMSFDILKAESTSSVHQAFDGSAFGLIAGIVIGAAVSPDMGRAVGTTVASIQGSDKSDIWTVGLRYKVVDTSNGQQVATGYFEEKLERQEQSQSFIGITQAQKSNTGFDTVVQKLVQKAVQDIDASHKTASNTVDGAGSPSASAASTGDKIIASYINKIVEQKASVQKFLDEMTSKSSTAQPGNFTDMAKYLCKEKRIAFEEQIKKLSKEQLDTIEKYSKSSGMTSIPIDFKVTEVYPDRSIVNISVNFNYNMKGTEYNTKHESEMTLVKEDNEWKICGSRM
jgi:hypothetical protein